MRLKVLSAALVIMLLLSNTLAAHAAVYEAGEATDGNWVSSYFGRWASPIRSYIIENKDGTVSTLDNNWDSLVVTTYSSDYRRLYSKEIDIELSVFGAYFNGEKYNYIAFGEYNTDEEDGKEVIRIVKYDKDFNRIASVSVNGGSINTRIPFNAGCPRMAENGNTLILHTTRENYRSDDGSCHQDSLTITIDTSSMTVIEGEFSVVSHSLDQYVLFDNGYPVFLDHGDAHPRSVVLKATGYDNWYGMIRPDMFVIPGEAGANCTGVSVGGFAISSDNYIVAMNTIDHSKVTEYTSYDIVGLDLDQRDIVLCVLKKGSTESGALLEDVKQIKVGKYVGTDKIASIPYLVALPDDTFAVLWQEFSLNQDLGDLVLLLVDDRGNALAAEKRYPGYVLSDCRPILDSKGNLVWYTDENKNGVFLRSFYTINMISKPSAWATNAVSEAKSLGLDTAALNVDYQGNTTRLEFCEAAVNLIERYHQKDIDTILKDKGLQPLSFNDVQNPKVSAAAAMGITSGTGDNKFNPSGTLTREQAATMLRNVLNALGFDTDPPPGVLWTDAKEIALWAQTAADVMYGANIMGGTSSTTLVFSPKAPYSHEQSIVTLVNLWKYVKSQPS